MDCAGLLNILFHVLSGQQDCFRSLIGTVETEKTFLSLACQRLSLHQLMKRLVAIKLGILVCDVCSYTIVPIIAICMNNIVDIFINNYTKSNNDIAILVKKSC